MGWFSKKKKGTGEDEMRALAAELGLTFAATDAEADANWAANTFPPLPLLRSGNAHSVHNLMYGPLDDLDVRIFNFEVLAATTDEFRAQRSCVLMTFKSRFPDIFLSPRDRLPRLGETMTLGGIAIGSDELHARWRIQGASRDQVRSLIGEEAEEWLIACPLDRLRIEIEAGAILGHVPDVPGTAELRALIDALRQFKDVIEPTAWERYRTL